MLARKVEKLRELIHGEKVKSLWKNSLEVPHKLSVQLTYDRVIPLQGSYAKELKTCQRKNLYVNVQSNIIHNSQK